MNSCVVDAGTGHPAAEVSVRFASTGDGQKCTDVPVLFVQFALGWGGGGASVSEHDIAEICRRDFHAEHGSGSNVVAYLRGTDGKSLC